MITFEKLNYLSCEKPIQRSHQQVLQQSVLLQPFDLLLIILDLLELGVKLLVALAFLPYFDIFSALSLSG